MTSSRGAVAPVYDSRETGPRYHVTTRINGETIDFQHPADDPFVRQTVRVARRDMLRCLLRGRRLVVEVLVGADRDVIDAVLALDANLSRTP